MWGRQELTSSVSSVIPDADSVALSARAGVCVSGRPALGHVEASADPLAAATREADGEGCGLGLTNTAARSSTAIDIFLEEIVSLDAGQA